jgi:hypothetical protein
LERAITPGCPQEYAAAVERWEARQPSELEAVKEKGERTGKPARRFKEFKWRTRKSWSRERRVVAKAEWTNGDANRRHGEPD